MPENRGSGQPRTVSRRTVLGAGLLAAGCAPSTPRRPTATPSTTAPAGGRPTTAPAEVPPTTTRASPDAASAVALTFHGAGGASLAVSLLAETERSGARVTVLAVGRWLEDNPTVARRILAGGHELGNHTYTHPVLTRLDAGATYGEIVRCRDVLTRQTGSPGRWFRPSGTPRATPLIRAQAARAGYPTCLGYDVDPMDYTDPGAAAITSRLLAAVRPGSVVSLHLGHIGTVAALPGVLGGLHARGLRAVTASALLGPA